MLDLMMPIFIHHLVGVPMPVVQMKCTAAGLNGSLLETPDAVVSTSTPNTIDSQVEIDTEQGATLAEESSPPMLPLEEELRRRIIRIMNPSSKCFELVCLCLLYK